MSQRIGRENLRNLAVVSDGPFIAKARRNSGMPFGIYIAAMACYLTLVGIIASMFLRADLAVAMVVFVGFVVAVFGLAALRVNMKPEHEALEATWANSSGAKFKL